MRITAILLTTGLWGLSACGPDVAPEAFSTGTASNLDPVCVEAPDEAPEGALVCGDDRTYECGVDAPEQLVVRASDLGRACGTSTLTVSRADRLELGRNRVEVIETLSQGGVTSTRTICTSTITIVDTSPPEVAVNDFELWPPNHRMVDVAPEDCATFWDACRGSDVDFRFTHVVVDEVPNGRGDGNTEPDVELGCDGRLKVRAERAGPGDSRVYRIGFEIDDGSSAPVTGECRAIVPHDRSARAAVEGEPAYRIDRADLGCGPGDVDGGPDDGGDPDDGGPDDGGDDGGDVQVPIPGGGL